MKRKDQDRLFQWAKDVAQHFWGLPIPKWEKKMNQMYRDSLKCHPVATDFPTDLPSLPIHWLIIMAMCEQKKIDPPQDLVAILDEYMQDVILPAYGAFHRAHPELENRRPRDITAILGSSPISGFISTLRDQELICECI